MCFGLVASRKHRGRPRQGDIATRQVRLIPLAPLNYIYKRSRTPTKLPSPGAAVLESKLASTPKGRHPSKSISEISVTREDSRADFSSVMVAMSLTEFLFGIGISSLNM